MAVSTTPMDSMPSPPSDTGHANEASLPSSSEEAPGGSSGTSGEVFTSAAILDDYERSERVYVLMSEQPIALDEVRAALGATTKPLAELDALPGVRAVQRSVMVVRE